MNAPTEKMLSDARILVSDVEELLKATASQTGERLGAARQRLQAALAGAKDSAVLQAREATEATDRYVKEHPWKAVGIAAGVSAAIGVLASELLRKR